MKEMEYSAKSKREILDSGYCLGLIYFIMNLGTHPTAYVKLPNNSKIDENDIDVHGGITYSEDHLWINDNEKIDGHFIGWDYGHCGDYGGYEELLPLELKSGRKRWTTEEIFKDVKEVCYQIKKEENNDNYKSRQGFTCKF